MKGVIIYKGKYGSTEQYAQWLGINLHLPVMPADEFPTGKIKDFDFFLIGSSVYIGKLQISKWLKENETLLQDKKIFFFQVAATPPVEKQKLQLYFESGVPESIRQNCQVYFLHGKMIKSKLSFMDRVMLKMGASLTKDPVAKKKMLTDFDEVKKENIAEIVNAALKYSGSEEKKLQYA